MPDLRLLPSVEQLLQSPRAADLISTYGRPLTLEAVRAVLEDLRHRLQAGETGDVPAKDLLLAQAEARLLAWTHPSLQPVINASGVILHTNLGRAPLSRSAIAAMNAASAGYSNLEFDLASGKRGSRHVHLGGLLQRLTGAEAALVVTNNAAAVLLALAALAARKRVVIARSQLVEIGGGFRVPDVMKQSGARLVEIGTTNKVRLDDFEEALAQPAGLVMRVHRSNFKLVGFTEEPGLSDIAGVAHRANIPLIDDLGSGSLIDTSRYGLEHEPMVQESLAAGADLVCFSGDKLLGGPQAGIIVGQAGLIARLAKHPLARAVRADKSCLAALGATLLHYLRDEAEAEIPIWRMISAPLDDLRRRAEGWAAALGSASVSANRSTVGGGSLPGETLPTCVLALHPAHPDRFMAALRAADPPVIARMENDTILLDPRTVLPEQENDLLTVLRSALSA